MTVILRARGLSKRFGATPALADASVTLEAGSVRGLVGENGAGKSTLLNVLAGVIRTDAGEMELAGSPYAPRDPRAARAAGVAMIHQELAIAPHLCVEANVMLGSELGRAGFVRRAEHQRRARSALERLGHGSLDLDVRCGDLPLALRQVVEIARALVRESRIVLLDEPASSLSAHDAEILHGVVRELARAGVAVAWVTHHLGEVERSCDTWSVLRDGHVVAEGRTGEATRAQLLQHMIGARAIDTPVIDAQRSGVASDDPSSTVSNGNYAAVASPREHIDPGSRDVVLEVRDLSGERFPREVDMYLCRGEIFGLFGLVGSGRSQLLRVVFGLEPRRAGNARLRDGPELARDPYRSVQAGLAFASEERGREGVCPHLAIEENVTLARLGRHAVAGVLAPRRWKAAAREALQRVHCACPDPSRSIDTLSGGNQQKVVLARLLHQDAQILLLDEPTRGIDVATQREVAAILRELAAEGRTILMTSSSTEELLDTCTTIGVMRRGRLVDMRAAAQWSRSELLEVASAEGDGR